MLQYLPLQCSKVPQNCTRVGTWVVNFHHSQSASHQEAFKDPPAGGNIEEQSFWKRQNYILFFRFGLK